MTNGIYVNRVAAKSKYIQLCKIEKNIPIFSKNWWLDTVCGHQNWDVIIVENDGKIIGSLPYYFRKRFGLWFIKLPPFTQTMGPWIKYPSGIKYLKKLEYEKKVFTQLIEQLPKSSYFNQSFNHSITNWLPFFWKGFKQTTRYTYVIEDISDLDIVVSNFKKTKKADIKKAEKLVEVKFDLSAAEFYNNHKLTLLKQNKKISYSLKHFTKIYDACYERDSGRTIYAVDSQGKIHAALFVIWDEVSAFNLLSTIDPDYRNSGAASLLIREIIRDLAGKTKIFDFEGSMIESVEMSFRQFGTIQKPYFNISKNRVLFDVFLILREIKNRKLI